MLLKEIYDTEMQMMDKYRRNYAYTYNTNSYGREASMDYVLRFWNEEKVNRNLTFYEKTDVEVYPMTEQEIQSYVETRECTDKAGSYAIQGLFAPYIKGICGDYNNVVGLPVARIYQEIKKIGLVIAND